MTDVIILKAYNTYPWFSRTEDEFIEIACNIDHITGISQSTTKDYPGSCVLLDNNVVLLVTEDEQTIRNHICVPHLVKGMKDFLIIEHWENSEHDRVWLKRNESGDEYGFVERFDWWSR